jgi:RNase adapter protein RapZ
MTQQSASKLTDIEVVSFGYKYGPPPAANLVLDLRFLENPHYDEQLRPLTGCDEAVQRFILDRDAATAPMLAMLSEQLKLMLRGFLRVGNDHVSVRFAFGCTGGKHRSRFFALSCYRMVNDIVAELGLDSNIQLIHRDAGRE